MLVAMTLRDQTRRFFTLLLFFLLGPMLTLGLVIGVFVRKAAWNARYYERTVAADTGFDLRIDSVEYRTPGCVRFRNVDLFDTATATPLFHAPEIEWTFVPSEKLDDFFPDLDSKKKGETENRPSLESFLSFLATAVPIRSEVSGFHQLTVPQSEIRFETLRPEESARKTQELLFDLLSRYRKTGGGPIQIALERVQLHRPNGEDSARFVQGNLYRADESVRSEWSFQIPGVSEIETQKFSVVERQSVKGSELVLRFSNRLENAYPAEIPCELVGAFSSFFHSFSKGSQFFGEITAEYRPSESENPWTFRMTDLFLRNLDLAKYAAEYTSFPITGSVDVQILQATFGAGDFTAHGWLDVQNGSLDSALFRRFVERFALRVEPPGTLELAAATVPFDQCVVMFRLSPEGATFWNDNPGKSPNLFMVRNHPSPMDVYLPSVKSSITYPTILTAFVSDTAPIVPLTPETQKIILTLPTEKTPPPIPVSPFPATAAPR